MARLRTPPTGNAKVDLPDLAASWLQGLNTTHDAGCGCGGLFAPALNARIIEEDFLDYLFARYEREQRASLTAFVDARRKDVTRGVAPNTFERWIVSLNDVALNDADRARLVADIATFVESMAGGARQGPSVCY